MSKILHIYRLTHVHRIGKEIGVDPNVILATSHGRRSIDVLKIYEPKLANMECKHYVFVLTKAVI